MKKLIIEPPAFLSMVISTVETYKLENFGLLLGYKLNYGFVVEHSIPLISAKRSVYSVEFNKRREKRVREIITNVQMGLEVVGDFHSHTGLKNWPAEPIPSPDDVSTMEKGKVYLIISVNESKFSSSAFSSWQYLPEGSGLKATVLGLDIIIKAYEYAGDEKVGELKIICPLATGI